jgi:hypothetical protein
MINFAVRHFPAGTAFAAQAATPGSRWLSPLSHRQRNASMPNAADLFRSIVRAQLPIPPTDPPPLVPPMPPGTPEPDFPGGPVEEPPGPDLPPLGDPMGDPPGEEAPRLAA